MGNQRASLTRNPTRRSHIAGCFDFRYVCMVYSSLGAENPKEVFAPTTAEPTMKARNVLPEAFRRSCRSRAGHAEQSAQFTDSPRNLGSASRAPEHGGR